MNRDEKQTFVDSLRNSLQGKSLVVVTQQSGLTVSEVTDLIGPISSQEDLEFCVSAEVMRLGPNTCSVSKNFLVKRVRAGAAKQIAGAKFTEIKEKQQERFKQQAAADTAAKLEAANGDQKATTL